MTLEEAITQALIKIDAEKSDFDTNIYWSSANVAQQKIACYGKHINKMVKVTTESQNTEYDLPDDLLQFKYIISDDLSYSLKDKDTLILEDIGTYEIYYWALPSEITKNTPNTYEFEVDKETHIAIPFYIAYECTKTDDVQLAQMMLNEFNQYMSLFNDNPVYRTTKIKQCYLR